MIALVELLYRTMTKEINCSKDGSYLLYTHKLYAEGSGSTQPMLLSSWINNNITVRDINLFPEKLMNGFMGHSLLVSAAENPPFAIRKYDSYYVIHWTVQYDVIYKIVLNYKSRSSLGAEDSNWDGLEVRLLRLSAKYLNFTVEFTEARTPADRYVQNTISTYFNI